VQEGNGDFNGIVAGNSSTSKSGIIATGKIENGKPHGKWTSTLFNNTVYCNEEFNHGKLIRGVIPNAALAGNKKYKGKSILNTFFLGNYLNWLEEFTFIKCPAPVMYSPKNYSPNDYSFDMQKFGSDLRLKIDKIVENDFRFGRGNDYTIGDNYLTIQFSVNEEGNPENFKLVTSWGQQFFNSISSSISMRTKFQSTKQLMFFHLKLHFSVGRIYESTFRFSKDKTF
jgi:hypothetical protein